jgi:demethylmenaquinone methyltransferase / 2-methoxy-6-polyprenyl-1,4-benzoquinol methylase
VSTETNDKKKEKIAAMFNDIAASYDFLNHFLSLNIDKSWRKKVVQMLTPFQPENILDVATGTGDLALSLRYLKPKKITGIDIAEEMLAVGRQKISKAGLTDQIELLSGDALAIPFNDETFDAVTVAFGIRNFENLEAGIVEINRVLKKDGVFMILEFSKPKKNAAGRLFTFYFRHFLPFIGSLFSKSKTAYRYLFDSVNAFPDTVEMETKLRKLGFKTVQTQRLSMGIATIYLAVK